MVDFGHSLVHFNHLNIIAYTRRPFLNSGYTQEDLKRLIEETPGKIPRAELARIVSLRDHNESLVENWNSVVGPSDTVYHLGDFGFGNIGHCLSQLNGHIVLIKGNHDRDVEKYRKSFQYIWQEAPLNRGVRLNGEKFILCHYPQLSWNAKFHGRLHFFGHVHSKPDKPYISAKNSYDVGVDNNNYTPIALEDACERARNNKNVIVFGNDQDGEETGGNTLDLVEL